MGLPTLDIGVETNLFIEVTVRETKLDPNGFIKVNRDWSYVLMVFL